MPAEIQGLKEFRRELKALGPEWPKELTKVHKAIAAKATALAQAKAMGLGGEQRKAAAAIKPAATMRTMGIAVRPTTRAPMAFPAFWGTKKRSGWYARARYRSSTARQHPAWVGNTWEVAQRGQGPYAINDALAASLPSLLDDYSTMLRDLTHRAFPEA